TVVNSSLTAISAPFTGAFGCQVRFGATQSANTSAGFSIAGGHLGLKPATGRSYTAGVDIDGGKFGLDGLTISATYYQTTYLGLITGGGATHPSLTNFAPPGGWTPTSPFIADFMANRVLGIAVPP